MMNSKHLICETLILNYYGPKYQIKDFTIHLSHACPNQKIKAQNLQKQQASQLSQNVLLVIKCFEINLS